MSNNEVLGGGGAQLQKNVEGGVATAKQLEIVTNLTETLTREVLNAADILAAAHNGDAEARARIFTAAQGIVAERGSQLDGHVESAGATVSHDVSWVVLTEEDIQHVAKTVTERILRAERRMMSEQGGFPDTSSTDAKIFNESEHFPEQQLDFYRQSLCDILRMSPCKNRHNVQKCLQYLALILKSDSDFTRFCKDKEHPKECVERALCEYTHRFEAYAPKNVLKKAHEAIKALDDVALASFDGIKATNVLFQDIPIADQEATRYMWNVAGLTLEKGAEHVLKDVAIEKIARVYAKDAANAPSASFSGNVAVMSVMQARGYPAEVSDDERHRQMFALRVQHRFTDLVQQ
jgi:hypothetical protein